MEPPSFPAGGPQVLRATPGSDAALDFPLPSGSPPFQFEWSRAGAKLSERFTSSHNAGGVRLSITAARTGDSGVYTLQASNAAGKDTTRVRLEVSPDEMPTGEDPPTFLRRLQDLTVKVGTRTRFLVEIVSSTECRVTWYRNERRLMEAERIALVRDGNFWCADISAVSVDDAGRWTCTAENIGGRASCSAHLNVLVPKAYKRPEFVEELRALLTEQGTVSLECKVVGVPTPVLRWFKDSREIKAGDVFALTANAEDPTSLGTYTCEAVNCMGRAYSSSKVQVVGRSSREGSTRPSSGGVMLEPPPIFTKELEDQFVRICDRLTLSCKIVVPPWPRTVVWYNKEGKVESNDKYHILEDGVGGYCIEIQTSEFPDEGEWKCVATSTGGRVGISTCYVSMDIPKNYRKPRFMENLQAVLTEEGLVSFECKVVGFPTPVLSWFKDGQELKPGDVYQLTGTNSLGSYCCIARNFMGQASSSAELTVEDIQNQLNEEEKLQLFSKNQAPKYLQGLKSVEAKIDEPFRFTIKVAIPPEPTVLWYRDEQPVDESSRCHLGNEDRGAFFLDIQNLEFMDQAEWKCVAMNDYGQSVTSCFLKLVIPRHYKKPRFLENLQAILSDEGAVNLECKVIGVPQPVLKWYKDGEELKPGDIHRIISGQDGTCCLGTYTCEAQNCMGIAASSASLLGFEDSLKAKNKKKAEEQTLQRNLSLSTIHEERTSQMYDTPVGDITLDDKGEISFSFDGKEVSVSLYETPDLTEEEALQIVEMYADQLSENVTEHNVVELPPLRFVKETSTSGNLLMEAIIIDVSPEYFTSPEEDLRTEADIEDISIADENGPPQLSLDQDVSGEDYLEKTMALLSEERVDISKKIERKKSDSQKSVDDYFSLSRDRSSSEEKKDDDTQVLSESDLQSFASAHSTDKPKSKSSKPSLEDGQESSDVTKTVLLKEDLKAQVTENVKSQRERRGSRGSRRSTSTEKSPLVIRKEVLEVEINKNEQNNIIAENIKIEMMPISSSLAKVMNAIQIIERDIILKSELMSVAATASRSLEIINSLITPLSEIHSITDTIRETENESLEIIGSLFNRLPQSLGLLEQSLTIVEKCIDFESDNKTLVKKTCVSLIEKCGDTLKDLMTAINTVADKKYVFINDICMSNIKTTSGNILKTLKSSIDASKQDKILNETIEDKIADISLESKHLHHTQKVLYALKSSLKSVLSIIGGSDMFKSIADIKNSEIILGEISTPIQELQNALEQIESLSVAESDSNLPKFNTEIIESVINSVLKLRTAFEKLSTDKENEINEVLLDIKQNIHSISSQLDLFEEKNGKFDILHNDNKLEVLQTMAQILITLENSLPILDTIPNLKTNMSDFHKNLTKVLENVIEGNDSTKYFTLLEICNAISRINTSLHNMESRQVLSLAVISNTLKTIQTSVHETTFENSLNKSVLKNINDLLLDIQETINQVEESTLNIESEKVDDLSIKVYEKNKLVSVLEHVQKTIVSMSKVVSFENVEYLPIAQVFENIHPILTEIQCCVASLNVNAIEHSENLDDMTISSFTESIAHPLCELHQSISILNEVICGIAKNHEITQFTALAEPLIELQTTLEILQAEVISQYEEIVQCPAILGSIANSVDNLQSCIVKIQEHDLLEFVDDMSTLDDISGIKTTADILLPTDQDLISSIKNIKIEEFPVIHTNVSPAFTTQALKTINKNILSLQHSVIAENVKALPDDDESLPIKSLIYELELINSDIEDLLQPITVEVPQLLLINPSKLTSMVQPLDHVLESLTVINARNITFHENGGDITQTRLFTENLKNLQLDLDSFLNILKLAVEVVEVAIDTGAKRVALQRLPEKLEILLSEYIDFPLDKTLKMELTNLHKDVSNALSTNISDNINAEEVNEIIEKVNKSISKVQDEGFNCTVQSLNILSHESKLVETLSEMEQCIATLEQSDIPEEFVILTPETDHKISQIVSDTIVDPLIHLDEITKTVVNAIYNESNECSENDNKLTEEFVDSFRKEISLLRYVSKNSTSPKQIIKSMQVFYALLSNLNNYKSSYHNTLSEEFNRSLEASLHDMENCLNDEKKILVQIIHSQSELLFDIPQTKINDGEQFLKNILKSKNDMLLHTTCSVILNIIESTKPFNDNLKYKMIEELSTYENMISQQDDAGFNDNYDYLASFLTAQSNNSLENPLKQLTEKLLDVIKKHEDVKNILGIGRRIIFIQCISDCIDLLKQYSMDGTLKESIEICIPKKINIDELLFDVSEPLDCFNTQIINIRNKIILASEKDIDLFDLKTLESHVKAIREVNENIQLCINSDCLSLDNNGVALVMELNNKIYLIFNNLKTLENTPIFETIKLLVNPIEEIEKNLHLIISYNKDLIDKKSQSNKEKAEALLQQMEQHIEIIEIVEEVSAVIRLDDLKETASIVRELRGSIAGSESAKDSDVEECGSITTDQIPLTDKLQKALISLQNQALDSAQQDTVNVKEDIRQQVIDAVSDLQNNLIQLTNISLENRENINNAHGDIVQEDDKQIILINTDNQREDILRHDEIKCELMESDQIISNTGDVAEDRKLSTINGDLVNLVPESKLFQDIDAKDLQVEKTCENQYNLSSNETSEYVYASKDLIAIVMENIQEYLHQDITDIGKQFASCLNDEAIKITQDMSQQFCQVFDLSNCLSMETTHSLIMSDEQLKILSNLHKNLESIFKYESAKELGEVVVEDKLIQFKNVAKNLCEAIQNLDITTKTSIKVDVSEELAVESPEVIEPKIEVDGSLSENQIFSCNYAGEKPIDTTNNLLTTDNEVLISQKDSIPEDMVTNKNVDANRKEDLGAREENLVQYISEYVSEEVTEIFKQTLSVLSTKNLEKSHQIANQLFTLCKVTNFDDTENCNVLKEKLELTIQLNESIMLIHNEIFDETKNLPTLFENHKLKKIQSVLKNLVDTLETYIRIEQHIGIEQVIELDKSKQELNVESIHKTEQTVGEVVETEETADLVCTIEELNVLSTIEKEDDEMFTSKLTKGTIIDKSDDSVINNESIEREHLIISTDLENETNSIQKLEKLLQEVNDNIDLSVTNVEYSEIIQNNLDEVQSVIIKLKYDFDGTANDALNETLEDLECNVRSVQLQINEQSPLVLLKEACSNLQVIVACLNNVEDVKETALESKMNTVISNCSEEADQTIQLLNKACSLEKNSKLDNIISCLNNVKDIMKSLRSSFVGNAETLVLKGIDIIQSLDHVEDTIFSLEKDLDKINEIDDYIKDNILTAMHSVYGSISNMRGAISSIQKRYMYENYGKPSQNFLKSIKNIADISELSVENKPSWKNCAKFFRKVLNHFEDIKFYINFDRTARIPNDAAFTKIILRETIAVLDEVKKLHDINSDVSKTINGLSNYVNNQNLEIEERTTLEVKDKIPIFIGMSVKILEATEIIKMQLQASTGDVSDYKFIQTDDREQKKLAVHSTVTGQCKEVQETFDLNLESTEFVSVDNKENEEVVRVTTEKENVLQEASKMESIAVVQDLSSLQDYQTIDIEPMGIDKEEIGIEKMLKNVEIMKVASEDLKPGDNYVDMVKSAQLQEDIGLTSIEAQCVEDVSPFANFSNATTTENDTREEQNIQTRDEIRDSQQVSKSLINIDKCEVLIEDNIKAEVDATLNVQERSKSIDDELDGQVKENLLSDILTLESKTSTELSGQPTTSTITTKNIQLNEDKGKVTILENTIQVGVLSNANLEDQQAADTNIETNFDNQEKKTITKTQPMEEKEIEKNKIGEQSQENIVLKNEEKDVNSQIPKDDTNKHNQSFSLSELPAISEKGSGDIITNQNEPKEITLQNQMIDNKQKMELYEDKSIAEIKESTLPDETVVTDSLCADRLNAESSLSYVLKDTDESLINKVEESISDNKSRNAVEQGVSKELSVESDTQKEDDILQKDQNISIDVEKVTENIFYNIGKEEIYLDQSENIVNDDNQLLERIKITPKTDDVIHSSIVDKIEASEGIKKSVEQNKELILISGANEEPLLNMQTDLDNKETEVTKSYPHDHENSVVNIIAGNNILNTSKDMDFNEIEKQEQLDINEADLTPNRILKEEYLNAEHKATVTEISEKNNKKDYQDSVIIKEDFTIKDDESSICKEKLEESVKCEPPESRNQIVCSESIEKNIKKPNVNLQSDLENKIASEVNPENTEVIDSKSHKAGKETAVKKHENVLVKTLESADMHEIIEPEQFDNKETNFDADTRVTKEYSEVELTAMVTETLEKVDENHVQENIILKTDAINKDDETSISKEKLEESLKCNQTESDNLILCSESIEKSIQNPNVILQSDLENKEATEPNSKKKEASEAKPEKKEMIDSKSYKDVKKAALKKHEENELVNIHEGIDIHKIKEQEQSDNKKENFLADTEVTKEQSEFEQKAMVTETLEKDNKKHEQESIILKKDDKAACAKKDEENELVNILENADIYKIKEQEQSVNKEENFLPDIKVTKEEFEFEQKAMVTETLEKKHKKHEQQNITSKTEVIKKDDESSTCKEKLEDSVKCNESESDNQIVFSESIEKNIQKPALNLQSDLENKGTKESKSKRSGKKAASKKHEENESINIREGVDIHQIKEQKQFDMKEEKFFESTSVEVEQNAAVTETIEKDDEKYEQESIILKKDIINKDDESSICKDKLEVLVKSKPPESDDQIVFSESIEKKIKKSDINQQSDLENKETSESKSEKKEATKIKSTYKEMIDAKSYKDGKTAAANKHEENELVNILESADVHQIKVQEQSDNKEENFSAVTKVTKEQSEFEHKAMVTETLQKDDKKHEQESIILKKTGKEAAEKKDEENVLVKILESSDMYEIREPEQFDNKEVNFAADTRVTKEHSEVELTDMVTETLEKVDEKHEQENIILKKDAINKDDETSISKEKLEESVKCNQLESDNQILCSESIEKSIQKPNVILQSDLENKEATESKSEKKEATEVKPKNKEVKNAKSYKDGKTAAAKKHKENELVKIVEGADINQIKDLEQSDKNEDNFTLDTKIKEENSDSAQKSMLTKISEKDNKKDDQESIKSNENDINEFNENLICKKKLEDSMECNETKSDIQVVSSESIRKEQLEPQGSVQSDLESKEKKEVIFYADDKINIAHQNATSKIDDIVKYKESSVNIRSDSEKKEIEEAFTSDEQILMTNSEEVEKVGFVKNMHGKQVQEITKSDNNETDHAIDAIGEKKYLESEKKPVVIELVNATSIDTQGKYSNNVEICELMAEVKNQDTRDILDGNNKKENVTSIENSINDIGKDSTSNCKQKDSDFNNINIMDQNKNIQEISTIENKLPIINDPNNTIEENKSKTLLKNKDEDNVEKKSNEVSMKPQEKNKRNGKKKQKSDKKKTLDEQKENSGEKTNIGVKPLIKETDISVKDEDKDIFEKLPVQVSVDNEQINVINTGEHTFSMQDKKSRSTEHKKYGTEDIKSGAKEISYSNTTNTNEYITNTEEHKNKEYLVSKKSTDNTYERVEYEKEKYCPKESPIFIDHNKIDYTLQFPRPSNYTSKSFDNEEFISSELNMHNRDPIYKAQTLMHDYRSRSSYSPNVDQIDLSSHNYGERAFARSRSKAVSESRSATSEKRTTRDRELKRKPVFSTFLTDRTAVESSRVKLTCSILSSSDPTITWYKNGTLLEDKHKFRSKFIDGLITLEVLNAIPNDSGEYSCTVGNEFGSITSSANLKVYPSFEASPIPPTFTRSIRDVYHSLENELVLECRIRGQPLPSITWYKDDKPITLCERYQAHYLADGVCRLTVSSPSKEDSGKYTCHAESSIWSDQIYHNVQFTDKESCVSPNIFTLDKVRLNRQVLESRKPHFTNVISDYKVVSGGTIGLQVEIKGSPTRVEWLREGCSVTDTYRNAQTYVDHGIYTLALTDVTEKESGLYTCRAWSSHGNVDMNASIIVVQPNQIEGKPAVIVSRPTKDVLISVGEDINISFRVQGEPKAKVIFMKGLRDITHSQRVCKMTSDDYIKFTLKRSIISDAGTYCILARNAYGCDRAFVTVVIRQRASSENLVSDWTYPMDDLAISALDRNYKAVPDRIPSEPSVVDGGKNWVSLAWPKPDCQSRAPILAYKVESWLIGKDGGARWSELGITPRNSFDAFNLKQEEEYHFRVTPRNRYGWGESVQTTSPIGIGLTGDRPEFIDILPGQLKVLLGETATLCCTFKGKPTPEILWMKNGHDVEEDTNRVRITLNSYEACLNIENVKIEDEGRYSCEASNIHGRSSTYARMTVITDRTIWEADAKLKRERSSGVEGAYPPQFTMRLRDRRVQATYPVRLTCQVIGSPAPVLTWFKNGEQVTADCRHNMSQDEYFYTLEIAPTALDDGGVYEAMARNSSGAISCRCSLVVDKGIRAYVAPEFCCGLEPLYQLREGEELRISAVVEAYPSVGVSWYRDGVRLRPSRRAIMTLDRDGQIEIALAFVTARDAGVYTCTASNEVGRVSTSGKVEILGGKSNMENVNAPPIFVSDESSSSLYSNEPRFLRKPRSSEAREGDTVIIECEVIGDPKPEVYWLRDFLKPDYYRDANHFKRVGAGPEYRFEIPHAKFDYTGAYSVVAKNIHGEAKAIISLQILARDPNSSQDAHNVKYGRVEVIPRFEKELTDLLCYDGDAIEFECRVSANPDPDIRWFHYSEVVPECPDFESSYDHGTARLRIKQVTAEDEGTYRCEASNSLGRTTSSACLVVYPPGEPNTLSQRLRRPPALLSGASTPRSTPRTTPRNTPRTTPARSLSATPGPDSRRLCSPCREISPKFYTYPFNRVAEEGDTVVFQCAVKGLPPPWATWDKDGIIITASSRITIKEKDEMFRILEIAEVNVEDVGLYRITLENDYGRAEASARLEVISGKGKFHGTRSYSASPSRRALTYRRRTPSFSRQD